MCGPLTYDFHGALHVLSDVGAEIEAELEDGEGPRVVSASINVPGHEISVGLATAEDLRQAFSRLDIVNYRIYGDVARPQRSGTVERAGWTVVVYGPAGPGAVL